MRRRTINLKRSTIARLKAYASTMGIAAGKSRRKDPGVVSEAEALRRSAESAEDLLDVKDPT